MEKPKRGKPPRRETGAPPLAWPLRNPIAFLALALAACAALLLAIASGPERLAAALLCLGSLSLGFCAESKFGRPFSGLSRRPAEKPGKGAGCQRWGSPGRKRLRKRRKYFARALKGAGRTAGETETRARACAGTGQARLEAGN